MLLHLHTLREELEVLELNLLLATPTVGQVFILRKLRTNLQRQKIKMETRTDIATLVNRFEQSAYKLSATQLRTEIFTAANIRLKEILKRKPLFGNQRVELLINRVGKRTVVLLNPSFFYFFNPFFVSRKLWGHC
jgi:hypothetical protein